MPLFTPSSRPSEKGAQQSLWEASICVEGLSAMCWPGRRKEKERVASSVLGSAGFVTGRKGETDTHPPHPIISTNQVRSIVRSCKWP